MALKQNVAEGGSHGDTVTTANSGGASGDAFNAITIGASATLTWSNARPQHGAMGIKLTNDSSNPTHFDYTGYSATQMVARLYVELDTLPSAGMRMLDIRTGSVSVARVILNASNQPVFQTNNGGTTLKTFTGSTFAADTKYRIEVAATPGNAADAHLKCSIYAGDSGSPIEAGYDSSTVTTGTTSNLTQVFFGSGAAIAWSGDAYFDDAAVQDGTLTFLGPYTGASIPGHSAYARGTFSAPTVTTETVVEGYPAAGRAGSNGATVSTAGISAVVVAPAGWARAAVPRPTVTTSSGSGVNPFAYMPTVTVEIAFNAGYTTPAASRAWTDVSAYVELSDMISIARGREDEFGTCNPNSLNLTLDNTDGRFTAKRAASPYYPNVKLGRPIRVTLTPPGGTASVRFLGYIDTWPVAWDGTDAYAKAPISATSRMARLGAGVELRSVIEEECLLGLPLAYYTMGEPAGSTQANDSSGNSQTALTATGVTFGNSTGPGTDALTAAEFSNGSMRAKSFPSVTGALTVHLFVLTSGNTVPLVVSGGMSLVISASGKAQIPGVVTSTTSVNNGATHHVAVTYDGATVRLYVDGVQEDSAAFTISMGTELKVGTGAFSTDFTGTMAHLAIHSSAITPAQVAAVATAGSTGFADETPAARIERYANYASILAAEVSAETGLTRDLAHIDTTGVTAIDMMRKVEATEGGVLFDGKDGTLVFHDRAHRYGAVSEFTISAALQQIGADITPTLDRSTLRNDITAALADGTVSVRVPDQDSIDEHGYARESLELHTTDPDAPYAAATWLVNSYKEPGVRIGSLEVDVGELLGSIFGVGTFGAGIFGADISVLLDADIGSRFTVVSMPSQAHQSSVDYFVEGYTETIGVGTYTFNYNVSPAEVFQVFTLDDAILGQIDGPYLLAW